MKKCYFCGKQIRSTVYVELIDDRPFKKYLHNDCSLEHEEFRRGRLETPGGMTLDEFKQLKKKPITA